MAKYFLCKVAEIYDKKKYLRGVYGYHGLVRTEIRENRFRNSNRIDGFVFACADWQKGATKLEDIDCVLPFATLYIACGICSGEAFNQVALFGKRFIF